MSENREFSDCSNLPAELPQYSLDHAMEMMEPDIMLKEESDCDNQETDNNLYTLKENNYIAESNDSNKSTIVYNYLSGCEVETDIKYSAVIPTESNEDNINSANILDEEVDQYSVTQKIVNESKITKKIEMFQNSILMQISELREKALQLKNQNLKSISDFLQQKEKVTEDVNKIKQEIIEKEKSMKKLGSELVSLKQVLEGKQKEVEEISTKAMKKEEINNKIERSSNENISNLNKCMENLEEIYNKSIEKNFLSTAENATNSILMIDELAKNIDSIVNEDSSTPLTSPLTTKSKEKVTSLLSNESASDTDQLAIEENNENQRTESPDEYSEPVSSISNVNLINYSKYETENTLNTKKRPLDDQQESSNLPVKWPKISSFENSENKDEGEDDTSEQENNDNKNKSSKKKKITVNNKPIFKEPFKYGWKRELVRRNVKGSKGKQIIDVYYYTPENVKTRSRNDISPYIINSKLTLDNFCTRGELIGINDETKEWIRDADSSARRTKKTPLTENVIEYA